MEKGGYIIIVVDSLKISESFVRADYNTSHAEVAFLMIYPGCAINALYSACAAYIVAFTALHAPNYCDITTFFH